MKTTDWRRRLLLLPLFITMHTTPAAAWGEAGHNIVGRVASRLLNEKNAADFAVPFQRKEYMIGHLANIPDIAWRNEGKEIADQNGPTHYVDFEFLGTASAIKDVTQLPQSSQEYLQRLEQNCKTESKNCVSGNSATEKMEKAGTNPLRVQQMAQLMSEDLQQAAKCLAQKKPDIKEANQHIQNMLLKAGIMAHFVGDLSQPLHTTKNYDGWDNQAGGLHGYFETDLVDAQPLSLIQDVFIYSRKNKPFQTLRQKYLKDKPLTPINMAWALTLASYARMDELYKLDRQWAMLAPSKPGDRETRQDAKRRPAATVAPKFHDFIVEQLALSADTLSEIWLSIWRAQRSPNLSKFHSFDYWLQPKFIKPDYMAAFTNGEQE